MPYLAPWTRVLLALMLHGQSWAASLSPIALPGIADSVIALADGSLIFNDTHGPTFSRLVPATGEVIEITTGTQQTRNPTLGADGRVWFTVDSSRQIGRYALISGLLDLFLFPPISPAVSAAWCWDSTAMWATASDSNRILRIAPTGAMSTYDLPSYDPHPIGIAQGPDGNIWFAERNAKKIGRITSSGTVTEFTVPPQLTTGPSQIVRGNDGGLWFATDDGFGRVATNGVFTLFPTGAQTAAGRLVLAPDGTFWLATGDDSVIQFTPPSGVTRLRIFDNPPAWSAGMLFDGAGNLYITDASLRQFGRVMKMVGASATPGDTAVIEFYNSILKHYFITASAEEAAGIDAGAAGPGWSRTGETWPAWLGGPLPGATEVCRFYGNAAPNPTPGSGWDRTPISIPSRAPSASRSRTIRAGSMKRPTSTLRCSRLPGSVPAERCRSIVPTTMVLPRTIPITATQPRLRYTTQMTGPGWRREGLVMCTAPAAP